MTNPILRMTMRTSLTRRAGALLLLFAAAACSPTDADTFRAPGILELYQTLAETAVPATAVVGQPFQVVVHTFGPNGCFSAGNTEVVKTATAVEISPFDLVRQGSGACNDLVYELRHEVQIVFSQPGTAMVRFHGVREPNGGIVTVTRTVDVQPAS